MSATEQRTPGLWHITYISDGRPHGIHSSDGVAVAQIYVTNEAMHANARFIASAPDMEAALEEIVNYGCDYHCQGECPNEIARAALAKARGVVDPAKEKES